MGNGSGGLGRGRCREEMAVLVFGPVEFGNPRVEMLRELGVSV